MPHFQSLTQSLYREEYDLSNAGAVRVLQLLSRELFRGFQVLNRDLFSASSSSISSYGAHNSIATSLISSTTPGLRHTFVHHDASRETHVMYWFCMTCNSRGKVGKATPSHNARICSLITLLHSKSHVFLLITQHESSLV